jgi:hypothetical protein
VAFHKVIDHLLDVLNIRFARNPDDRSLVWYSFGYLSDGNNAFTRRNLGQQRAGFRSIGVSSARGRLNDDFYRCPHGSIGLKRLSYHLRMAGIEEKGSLQRLHPFPVCPIGTHDAVPMCITRNQQVTQLVNDCMSQYDAVSRLALALECLNENIN